MQIIVDNRPISYEENDSILIAMMRSEMHPTGGGCLCLGGDCKHCVATVNGVSYVRTCQMKATPNFTSGGAGFMEMWVRDRANGLGMDVRILPETESLGAINVTGPLAGELMKLASVEEPPFVVEIFVEVCFNYEHKNYLSDLWQTAD